jgi:DNA helicase-2/ATP-dependent DNA helicase PcrA
MTLHAAKGLEFPVVFVVAVEENIIPHERSLRSDDPREVEEERRLLFVGMTRARERLYLTHTQLRDFRGSRMCSIPSGFLRETEYVAREILPSIPEMAIGTDIDTEEHDREEFDEAEPDNPAHSDVAGRMRTRTHSGKPRAQIMTGADLLNKMHREEDPNVSPPLGFSIGMSVRHPLYGLGTVVEVGGFAKRSTVTVEFRENGRSETFVASKCPLQPVGIR